MSWVVVAVGAVSAGLSYSSSKQQNKRARESARLTKEEAERRYEFEADIAEQQIAEQDQLAMSKMTDISVAFLKAKGQMKAVQAETGVTGNIEKRKFSALKQKESVAKGDVAQEINTNKINIAQGMLAKKIDTEAIIKKSRANELSTAMIAINALNTGISTFGSVYSLGSLGGAGSSGSQTSAQNQYVKENFTDANNFRGL